MGEGPEREPDSPELEEERARRLARFSRWAQAGFLAFLAVVALGFLPSVIAAVWPAARHEATVLVMIVAPAVPIVLLVVAALRLRR
jgi:uncharacterized membrane protein YqjE